MGKIDDLEKAVKDNLKQKNFVIDDKMAILVKEIAQDTYLKKLEEIAIEYQPTIMFSDSEANKKYARLRTIVLSLFALIEANINLLIRIKLDRNYERFYIANDGIREAISILLDEKNFSSKIKVVSVLYEKENIDKDILYKLADVRNVFAHSLDISDKRYIYGSKNIFTDLDAFDNFQERVINFSSELRNIISRQQEVINLNTSITEYLKIIKNAGSENNEVSP